MQIFVKVYFRNVSYATRRYQASPTVFKKDMKQIKMNYVIISVATPDISLTLKLEFVKYLVVTSNY